MIDRIGCRFFSNLVDQTERFEHAARILDRISYVLPVPHRG